jgi:Family of unknown function (DUF6247)
VRQWLPVGPRAYAGARLRSDGSDRRRRAAAYDNDLDAAFEETRHHGDLTPLMETVGCWWFEAGAGRDPDAQRGFLARIERYQQEGPPPPEQCITREEIRAQYGV